MAITPNHKLPLIPDRHPQADLFICDVADAVLKDFVQEMEHPFYSLSKKPERTVRRYEHNDVWLEITPSVKGLATIYDKDILIYCVSQIMSKLNNGERVSQTVRISARDLLIFTNRGTAGKDYNALCEAVDRLGGTRISTNIRTGNTEQYKSFGLIDEAVIKRTRGRNGRLDYMDIKLSDWVFNAIQAKEVLTLNRDYFRLRKPTERRIYELARKHCGSQPKWAVSIALLHKKSGSKSPLKEFRRSLKHLNKHNHLPDYSTEVDFKSNQVLFKKRGQWQEKANFSANELPPLSPETIEKAKNVAPGLDIYFLEEQWRNHWAATGKPVLDSPQAAFIGFCKKRYLSDKPDNRLAGLLGKI